MSHAVAPVLPDRDDAGAARAGDHDRAAAQATADAASESCKAAFARSDRMAVSPLRPLGDPGYWIVTDDYPRAAVAQRVAGVTGVDLAIDDAGRPLQCHVLRSSGHPLLDRASCAALMRSARFTPARDAIGCPLPAHYRTRVRWQLPA